MINRDTFRLIKRTKKRFITLFLMVMIGVAFMVGLMSTSSIMQRSVDVYFDQNNLMDIQIYSNYGFCEDDIEAFRNTRTVKDVVGSKFYDAYVLDEHDDLYVTRFEDLSISKKNIGSKMRVYDWFSTFLGDSNRYEYYKEFLDTGAECEFECFDLESDEVNFHKIKFYKMENVAKDGGECYCLNKNYYINPKEVDNIIFSEILYDIDNVLNQD